MNIKQTCQYVLAALTGLLSSCISDINLDYLKPTPKVVLNSIAIAYQPLVATVSCSWFYTEDNPNVTLKDARVDLYVNNVYHEQLTWMDGDIGYNSKGFYTSTYREHIQLIAHVNDFTGDSFETVVPEFCQLLRCTAELKRNSAGHESYFFHITLKDKVTEQNFYMVRIEHGVPYWKEKDETWDYMWIEEILDYSKEPLFHQNQSTLDKVMGYGSLSGYFGCVFSDELINGEKYTLNIMNNGYNFPLPARNK